MYAIETDKGFYHSECFWHNINVDRLVTFDSRIEAEECGDELMGCKEIKHYRVINV